MLRTALLGFLVMAVSSGWAQSAAFLQTPDIHGDQVVFSREGDLWLGNIVDGTARRLTRHDGLEIRPRFSPDGSQIAFTGQYDGGNQVYVIPTMGGVPRRVTSHLVRADMETWTPDGRSLVYLSVGPFAGWQAYRIALTGGTPELLPFQHIGNVSFGATERQVAFTRFPAVAGGAWFRYEGGSRNDIWTGDLQDLRFRKIYESRTQSQYPQWVGNRIYFVREENATFSVVSVREDGRDYRRHAGPYDVEVMDLETDGRSLIYVKGPRLEMIDLATGAVRELQFDLKSDLIHARPFTSPAAPFLGAASIGPTGARVFVEVRGQIVSVPAKEGDNRVLLAKPGVRYRLPTLSPDGTKLAYTSDETRETQVFVANADGSQPRQVTFDGERQINSILWSPDSKMLAITDSETRVRIVWADGSRDTEVTRGRRAFTGLPHHFSPDSQWFVYQEQKPHVQQSVDTLHLLHIATGRRYDLSDGFHSDYAPAFSTDGRFLVFVSRRNYAPEYDNLYSQLASNARPAVFLLALRADVKSPFLPAVDEEPRQDGESEAKPTEEARTVSIDVDGLSRRLIRTPMPPGDYQQVAMVGNRILAADGSTISYYDVAAKRGGRVIAGSAFEVSADGKKLLVQGPGSTLRVVDVTGTDLPPATPTIDLGPIRLEIDPVREWEQIYWDAWRLTRDYFYVRNMHGADWNAIGAKYAAYLPEVRSRSELTELIRWMQAELSAGHSFRRPPLGPTLTANVTPGYLGIETEPDGGFHRITRIYDGDGAADPSPLAAVGLRVEVGMYLIEVAGKPAAATEHLSDLLGNTVGQVVSVRVNDRPTAEGARTIFVRPIGVAEQRNLWILDRVKQNREAVTRRSNGRIGYIYLGGMGDSDYGDFTRQWFPQLDKDGIIIDIRGNRGGYIGGVLVSILRKETYMRRSQRNSIEAGTRYHDSFEGHLTVLINHDSYSDGEGFPNRFKHAGLGPLIGTRTYGALVGSAPMWPLIDGGGIQVPRYGNWRDGEGWVVEGPGVAPDIAVDNDPNEWARGVDQQLDRAVDELLRRARANPVVRPVQPPDPTTARTRGGG